MRLSSSLLVFQTTRWLLALLLLALLLLALLLLALLLQNALQPPVRFSGEMIGPMMGLSSSFGYIFT